MSTTVTANMSASRKRAASVRPADREQRRVERREGREGEAPDEGDGVRRGVRVELQVEGRRQPPPVEEVLGGAHVDGRVRVLAEGVLGHHEGHDERADGRERQSGDEHPRAGPAV
jgi:hypothetical protein